MKMGKSFKDELFNKFFERNANFVYNTVKSVLGNDYNVADVVQEVFFKCWRIKPEIVEYSELEQLKYISICAKNMARNYYKKRKKEDVVYIEDITESEQIKCFDREISDIRVSDVVKELPEIYKDLFSMKYIYGLRNSEIAEIYEVSESTISIAFAMSSPIFSSPAEMDATCEIASLLSTGLETD